jgi:hypothetical protein
MKKLRAAETRHVGPGNACNCRKDRGLQAARIDARHSSDIRLTAEKILS